MTSPTDQHSGTPAIQSPEVMNSDTPGTGDTSTGAADSGTASDIPFGPAADANEVGTLGPYRVVRQLGRGGMGAVFLAVDSRLNRKLALKVMLPQYAADRIARERFLREAQAAAQIAHDNVVTVYEADERDGVTYIAMQFLQGYPLDEYLKKKGRPGIPQVIRLAREAAAGLAAAHKIGLVHRDIKPANIWLEAPNGRVKVLDFGLAKPLAAQVEMTQSGVIMGTPAYMSPEQARGSKVDPRADLFSLGAMLYQLCTGRLPFEGPNIMAVLTALATENPRPVRELNPEVPQPLADLIHQLLAKKPDDRPASADEVVRRLRTITEQTGQPAPHTNSARPAAAMSVTVAPDLFEGLEAMVVTPPPATRRAPAKRRSKTRRARKQPWFWAAAAAIGVTAGVTGVSLFNRLFSDGETSESPAPATNDNRDTNPRPEIATSSGHQEPAEPLDDATLLKQAQAHAARRDWQAAAATYAQVIDHPVHEWGELAFEYAAVLLLTGDKATYKEVCAQLVERAGPPGIRPYHAARACTLAADSYMPAERPAEMAQEELDRNGTAYWWDWLQGAQLCRAGRYQEALPLLQKSLNDSEQRPDGEIGVQLWMALAYHELNQPEEARQAFEQAQAWLAKYPDGLPQVEHERTELGLHLHNWLEIQVLQHEVAPLLDQ